jgi:GalNAc-alpha-(1->4)-GalNAc-alpha-(1->3)-diNAcBac-PP-undecaprenol alpha-1,4-N-acetyl-D-galactosaminyltransferase
MQPMRLMFVIYSLGAGGAERVASTLVNSWAATGDEVTIVTIASAATDFYPIDAGVKRLALDLANDSRNWVDTLGWTFKRLNGLRAVFRSCQPDVIVSFLDKTNILVLLASLRLNIPLIVSERNDPRQYALGPLTSFLRRITYPFAHALVVQTEEVARWARRIVRNDNVYVIPNPIRPVLSAKGRAATDKKSRTIIAIGRMQPQKGFDLLLRAFARCYEKHPNWNLRIIGDGPERERLSVLARELGIGQRLILDGLVRSPLDALQAADLFVLSSRFEGFPNVLLEAMTCGLAVISFNCPSGPSEIIRNSIDGILVSPGDVGALVNAMDLLMGNDLERHRLGDNAVEVTERFSVPRIMAMWDQVLSIATKRSRKRVGSAPSEISATMTDGLYDR